MADVSQRMRDHYPSGLPDDPEHPTPPDLSRAFADAAKLADGLANGAAAALEHVARARRAPRSFRR